MMHEDVLSEEVMYEEAMKWMVSEHQKANAAGDHITQRIIEYIQEVVWRDNDMRNS